MSFEEDGEAIIPHAIYVSAPCFLASVFIPSAITPVDPKFADKFICNILIDLINGSSVCEWENHIQFILMCDLGIVLFKK